jgi:hypothetical protein
MTALSVAHSPHYLAWRDGFHARPLACACTACLAAYTVGLRRGDRTRRVAGHVGNASPTLSGLVSGTPCVVGSDEAALTS